MWNLQRLAQTLSPFVAVDGLNEALDSYQQVLLTHYGQRMRQKLGFMTELKEDNALLNELFSLMARERSDYTRTFRMLSLTEQHSAASPLRDELLIVQHLMTGLPVIGGVCNKTRLPIMSVSN